MTQKSQQSDNYSQNYQQLLPQQSKQKRNLNADQLKNERITRRMKKMIKSKKPFDSNKNEKCAICLSECESNSATLPCSHFFCIGCISNWWITNPTCPYCRSQFSFIYDYKGRKLTKQQLPEELLIKREETLKCQSCWADIGDEPMRICFECRCVYMHKRCMHKEQLKVLIWKCQECLTNEQQQYQKMQQKKQKQGGNYIPYRANMFSSISQRHSQRLMLNIVSSKHK